MTDRHETTMVLVTAAIAGVFFLLADQMMRTFVALAFGIADFFVSADRIMRAVVTFILGIGG